MRCKVGDIALIVYSGVGFEGMVCRVVEPSPIADWRIEVPNHPAPVSHGLWSSADSSLRPLLPGDEEDKDETPTEIIREMTEQGS